MNLKVRCCLLAVNLVIIGCRPDRPTLRILGNIEDPQNEIAITISQVLNANLDDNVEVVAGLGSLANFDSLITGKADLAIVDNYLPFSDSITTIMPLYPQVLHILCKKNIDASSLKELLASRKIFAGTPASGTRRFVEQLIEELGVSETPPYYVDIIDLFDADVIFSFTDLLTSDELKDMHDYKLFSIDDIGQLGKGSQVEAICTRYPQFEPFVIARDLYGSFSERPVLTIKVDALLVCRKSLDRALIFSVVESLTQHGQEIKKINPLLYDVFAGFDSRKLTFSLHDGAREFLERDNPTFLERNADVFGVIISVVALLASASLTLSRWNKVRRKNKIDRYYMQLFDLRSKVASITTQLEAEQLLTELRMIQEEAIQLVTKEQLLADESFLIYLNISKLVSDEILLKKFG